MVDEFLLPAILAAGGLGSAALVAVSAIALFRRQSLSYFLVTVAIGALLLRSFLGAVTFGGFVHSQAHHLFEHALDVVVIGLLFGAVYAARRIDPDEPTDGRYRDYSD